MEDLDEVAYLQDVCWHERKMTVEDLTVFDNITGLLAYTSQRSSSGEAVAYLIAIVCAAVSAIIVKMRKTATARMADLTMTIDDSTVEPGQELSVAVELVPKKDFHVERAVVQLIRVETYIDKVTHRSRTSYHKETKEKTIDERVFLEDEDVGGMRSVGADVRLTVPWGALPTAQGRTTRGITPGVSWKVITKFDVPKKFDPAEEQDIIVEKPSNAGVPPSCPAVAESNSSVCSLTLLLDSADVHQGGSLEGVFRVQMHKDADISRVTLKFEGTEKFGDVSTSVDIDELVLSEHTALQSGRVYDWPFQLQTSEASMPTLRLKKSKVEYSVIGKLDRKKRRDPSVSQDVNVVTSYAGGSHAGSGNATAVASGHYG